MTNKLTPIILLTIKVEKQVHRQVTLGACMLVFAVKTTQNNFMHLGNLVFTALLFCWTPFSLVTYETSTTMNIEVWDGLENPNGQQTKLTNSLTDELSLDSRTNYLVNQLIQQISDNQVIEYPSFDVWVSANSGFPRA